MTGFCAYFSHSAQVTRNAHETLNPAIAPGFLLPKFHCSQGSLTEGLDADKPVVQRYGKTPAAHALCSHLTSRVARDQISEIDALGCRRWDCLRLTAGKTAHLFRAYTLARGPS
nr:MAG TPA: hypothetical protein [Bacteriophage sp.]